MKKMNGFFNDTSRHNENWNFIFLWFCILKANNNQKESLINSNESAFKLYSEKPSLLEHISRIKDCDNVYLDLSGTGIMRYGVVKELINCVGKECILFGTDYPVCNPAMYVATDLTDAELEHIFYKNAERVYKHTYTVNDFKA